jgi:small subunit ribosomal protein S23
MGRFNFKPSRVYQTATQALQTAQAAEASFAPSWYTTIGSIPPSEILTRIPPAQQRDGLPKRRTKKLSKMFMPVQITYEEDRLRKEFYGDHPWELARPRIILEQDGKDGQKCDWSKIQQPGRQLNAERYAIKCHTEYWSDSSTV